MNEMELYESISLIEDTVAKFGGEVYPKFGWACILAGGAGSGKGYSLNHSIPIDGRVFDVDNIKAFFNKKSKVDEENGILTFEGTKNPKLEKYLDGKGKDSYVFEPISGTRGKYTIDLKKTDIGTPYNTTNSKYTELLHFMSKRLSKDLEKFILRGDKAEGERLPNLIFDGTMKEPKDYTDLIPALKDMGYRIAIVYVLTGIDTAVYQNKDRGSQEWTTKKGTKGYGRLVDRKILMSTHKGMIDVLQSYVFAHGEGSEILDKVSDIWAILTTREEGVKPKVVDLKRAVPAKSATAKAFADAAVEEVEKFIEENSKRINDIFDHPEKDLPFPDPNKKPKPKSPPKVFPRDEEEKPEEVEESFHIVDTYELYEALRDLRKLRGDE